MKNIIIITITLLAALLLFTPDLLAQPGLPGSPSQAPIDGGLLWLLLGGGAYGVKKLRDRNNDDMEK